MNCRHRVLGLLSILGVGFIVFAALTPIAPKFVWNLSESAPTGLYRVKKQPPGFDDYALVQPSDVVRKLIEERGYLPAGTPLIKRVAALPGDQVCRRTQAIFINEAHVADAHLFDSLGREMPQWSGCLTLQNDEFFLLNAHEKSLDGRYFGATNWDAVIGVAIPIWVKEQEK